MSKRKNLEYEIIKNYGVIAEKTKGWRKEINSISWNGAEPKYDIRDWSPDHQNMGKGVTLTENELYNLYNILKDMFSNSNNESDVIKNLDTWNF